MHKRIGGNMTDRAYDLVRQLDESIGVTIAFEKSGFPHGAWIITLSRKRKELVATGDQSFPDLDKLYKPKVKNPRHWDDYLNELQPDADFRLLVLMGLS